MEEIWKDIEDFEGVYQVSTFGRIQSFHNNRHGCCANPKIINGCLGKNGYYTVSLFNPKTGKRVKTLVHRIVAKTFIPNHDGKGFVDHINTIRTDNRVDNLRWVTQQENNNNCITVEKITQKAREYGMTHRGSKSASAKPVGQYSLDGLLIHRFGSLVEASEKTGIPMSKIRHNVNFEQKQADGYIFKLI